MSEFPTNHSTWRYYETIRPGDVFLAIHNLHKLPFRVPSDPDTKKPKGHRHSETQAPGVQNMPDDHRNCDSRGPGRRNPVTLN